MMVGKIGMSLWSYLLLSSLFYVTHGATNRSGEATYQLVYDDIQAFVGCYRRFNGTHEIGCSTGRNGNVGVIHYIHSSESLNWLIEKGPHKPYIPLITSRLFVGSTVKRLINSEKINGIMVIQADSSDTDDYPSDFSPDAECPNEGSSIYSADKQYSCQKHKFNPSGTGIMFDDLKMPVMLLKSQEEVEKVVKCYQDHNLPPDNLTDPSFPLCSAELKAFMHGAGNSEICLRRNAMIHNFSPMGYCQELGGYSSHAFLAETKKGTPRNKTIVLIARTDAFSLFEYSQPGTSSPAAGIAVLLSLAETLKPKRDDIINAGFNILFLALTGESFDYIGSQKLVYDMKLNFFPNKSYDSQRMDLSDVDLIIELSQFIDVQNKVYMHTDPKTKNHFTSVQEFISQLGIAAKDLQMSFVEASANQPLPPSSAQMFIRARDKNGMPAIVLADYDTKFKTDFYNSYLDTPEIHGLYINRSAVEYDEATAHAQLLSDVSTVVSRALVQYTTGQPFDATFRASNKTIHHVLYCLLLSPECDLFYTVISPNNMDVLKKTGNPFPFYVSVYQQSVNNQHIQLLMLQLLAYFTGDTVDLADDVCQNNTLSPLATFWMSGHLVNGSRQNLCMKSTAQYHNATSPAFEIEGYNFSSGQYSTWTESVWPTLDPFHVRIFLKPSAEVELASMVAGISLFIIAAIVSVLTQRRAAILFPPHNGQESLITDVVGPT